MKFFKSEHAESFNAFHGSLISITKANEMLEREGKVVFAEASNQPWHNVSFQGNTHRALLINISPLDSIKPTYEELERENHDLEYANELNRIEYENLRKQNQRQKEQIFTLINDIKDTNEVHVSVLEELRLQIEKLEELINIYKDDLSFAHRYYQKEIQTLKNKLLYLGGFNETT